MIRLAAAALALLAAAASGQPRTVQEPDRIVVRKHSRVDFGAQGLESSALRPSDTYIPVRRHAVFDNLIQIRGSFAPELQQSADRL